MRLAVVRLIGSVLRLHAFISASNTRNVLFMMEKVVYLPLCVFVMQFREIFSTACTFVSRTFFASCLSLFIHHVKILHGDCLLTSNALSHLITLGIVMILSLTCPEYMKKELTQSDGFKIFIGCLALIILLSCLCTYCQMKIIRRRHRKLNMKEQ